MEIKAGMPVKFLDFPYVFLQMFIAVFRRINRALDGKVF